MFQEEPIAVRVGIPEVSGATNQATIKMLKEIRLRNLRLNLEPEEKGTKSEANMNFSPR
jgi:hypothetical protein